MTITGCAPSPSGGELLAQAREINFEMKEVVAELQLYIYDGDWDVPTYGIQPKKCGAEGYRFDFIRSTPTDREWRLPQGSPRQTADDLMRWLEEHEWTDIVLRSFTDGIADITVTARNPSAHIDDLLITVSPGKVTDGITLRTTSTCEPGDNSDLSDLMFPEGFDGYTFPKSEHPTAEPHFEWAPGDKPTPTPTP